MTPKFLNDPGAFIKKIHGLYRALHEKRKIAPGIYRGTNPSVSADAENLFARYLKERLPGSVEIWVDSQISYIAKSKNKQEKRIFRPDICVIRGDTVIGAFELKMDLGYIREEFVPNAKKQAALLRKLVEKKNACSIAQKGPPDIYFAGNLVMNFVVINGSNISRDKLRKVEDAFKAKPPGPLFILSRGKSLDRESGYTIDTEAFGRLEKTIKGIGKSVRVSGRQQR
jgi:hypothetical protein